MAKTLIDINEEYLDAAQQALGTATKKDTVNAALREVTALAARRRDLERLTSGSLGDLENEEVRRSSTEFDELRADRTAGYEWLATHDQDWRRALDVQASLWRGGCMRAAGFSDLLVAAVAERERVTVLHYDGDYELIAQLTSQPMQWVVPRGTVP